jgi:pimeloyl-ACP methyl ester carboxylesterase
VSQLQIPGCGLDSHSPRCMQVYRQVQRLAESWKHPDGVPMYYSVSWDWRRDVWDQAPRIMKALRNVYSKTGCKAILVGHSFGGRMLYTVLARYGQKAAELTAGALYAAAPFHGSATHVAGTPQHQSLSHACGLECTVACPHGPVLSRCQAAQAP